MVSYRKGVSVQVAKLETESPELSPLLAGFFLSVAFIVFLAHNMQIVTIISKWRGMC